MWRVHRAPRHPRPLLRPGLQTAGLALAGGRVIYLSGCVTQTQLANPRSDLGFMLQPGMGTVASFPWLPWVTWAADNGCFAKGDEFDAGAWLEWLASLRRYRGTCHFAVAPDVLGDWESTWARSAPYFSTIRQLGFKAALVAQDGMPLRLLDLGGYDALFIGGTDAYKLSEPAYQAAEIAHRQGRWVHLGRVNSLRRLQAARVSCFDSADGTYVAFGPDRNLPRVYDWLDAVNGQQTLMSATTSADGRGSGGADR